MSEFSLFDRSNIITLSSADGKDLQFKEITRLELDGKWFGILQPVELLEGMTDDEALVFEIRSIDENLESFAFVEDDEQIDEVFAAYYALLDEPSDDIKN